MMTPDPLLDGLNPQQEAAVVHAGGPLLVVAGAGSGKTRVLTRRIAYLMRKRQVKPYEILAITFTNKAAGEMKDRVTELVGPVARSMWVSTFHSACVRILRQEAAHLGYTSSFTIYDQADSLQLIKKILDSLNQKSETLLPRQIQAMISGAKNELQGPTEFLGASDSPYSKLVAEVFSVYQHRLQQANAMDFDDLILKTVEVLQRFPESKARYRSRFKHVLIDEYQDTNHAQYMLIRELVGSETEGMPPAELCVVGDADQSVYGFRGATIRNILQFELDYPSATTILLEQNYRSTQNILSAANAVIAKNVNRKDKNLWSAQGAGMLLTGCVAENERAEANFIQREIGAITRSGDFQYRNIAIFYRTNAQSRAIEQKLTLRSIPYKVVGGLKFYDRKEVKDLLAYLRILVNPSDEVSLRRIINVPTRGIGDKTIDRIDEYARLQSLPFSTAMEHCQDIVGLRPQALTALLTFLTSISDLRQLLASDLKPSQIIRAVITKSGLEQSYSQDEDPQDEVRLQNMEDLANAAIDYEKTPMEDLIDEEEISLSGFLGKVSLVADADDIPSDEEGGGVVTLMTLHTAKGLEFPVVFLTGLEEGIFPHFRSLDGDESMEEERRLAYVGLTRAKERLYVSRSEARTAWKKKDGDGASQQSYQRNSLPSRFLAEIPEAVIEWREDEADDEWSVRGNTSSWVKPGGSYVPARRREFAAPLPRPTGKVATPIELVVGDRVSHDTFGLGKVISLAGEGPNAAVTVDFGSAGEKRLLLRYAPVEKL